MLAGGEKHRGEDDPAGYAGQQARDPGLQHRIASLMSYLGSFQIVSIDIRAKDLREESCNVLGERTQDVLDLGNAVT